MKSLTRINLDDMISNLGWERSNFGRWIASALFHQPAQQFGQQVIDFDRDAGRLGLQEGARQFLPTFVKDWKIHGQENIPTNGPLLVVSNHPGMADTLILLATLPRPDLRVVASERPFLQSLPAISRSLIYIPDQAEGRFQAIRSIISYMRAGGAVLTFPAGEIEPDPAVLPGASQSLDCWSESIGIFVRTVPRLAIVGAVVSHVLAPQATYHPLTRLRRKKKDRERLGATIQLLAKTLAPGLWPLMSEVTYTPPLDASNLAPLNEPASITRVVIDYIKPYIEAASRALPGG